MSKHLKNGIEHKSHTELSIIPVLLDGKTLPSSVDIVNYYLGGTEIHSACVGIITHLALKQ